MKNRMAGCSLTAHYCCIRRTAKKQWSVMRPGTGEGELSR
jgi:hypothetical protein